MKKLTAIVLTLILAMSMTCVFAEPAEASFADLLGAVNGDVYENAALGFGFKAEGWTFLSEDEIAANMQLTKALLGEEASKYLDSGTQLQVMMATAPDGITNINAVATYLGSDAAAVEQYGLENVMEAGKSEFTATIESAGLKVDSLEVVKFQVAGKEIPTYQSRISAFGMTLVSDGLYFISGEYMVIITITALDDATAEEVMNGIYWL